MLKFMGVIFMMMIMKKMNTNLMLTLTTLLFNMSLQKTLNSKTSYWLSSDTVSFWITSMTMMVTITLMLIEQKKNMMNKKIITIMMMILISAFNNWNFMMFYVMFEMSMIIILLIIISWGYQPERTEALMFMIIMTLMFSLPFLLSMMANTKSLSFWFMEINMHLLTFMSFMFIFMMKMPIYFTHFWLPKVHVEAPVQGSMILAAILLKLGCYGMIRMNKIISKFNKVKPMIIAMSMWSMIILSMNCIIQTDMKTMIAYSSIVHMTMVFTNILIMKAKSIFSSMLIILGHGLCAALLFFMANIMYKNSKSRSMMMNKGNLNLAPSVMFMWFVACMNNAPMPPSMNMLGELISFKNLMSWCPSTLMAIITTAFLSSMYSIYLFFITSHSNTTKTMTKMMTLSKNSILMTTMATPMVMIMVKPATLMI